MRLLALETATESCSVALLTDGEVREEFFHAPRLQTQLILPMVERLLAEAGLRLQQLDAIAFSRGPGAFTGVRIATSVAQGLAFGANLPVIPVSSLQSAAQGVWRTRGEQHVYTVFDARMDEVYFGAFVEEHGRVHLLGEEQLAPPADIVFPQTGAKWFGAGNGWVYREKLTEAGGEVSDCDVSWFPHAQDVAVLAAECFRNGEAVAPELGLPVYLRDEVWKKLPGR